MLKITTLVNVATLSVLSSIALCAERQPLPPPGWRLPAASETAQSWRHDSSAHYVTVDGDFQGQGSVATAKILVRQDGSGFAPFVFLKLGDGSYKFVQAEKTEPLSALNSQGIKLVKPGTYVTACGKGYGDCSNSDSKQIKLTTDAIEIFVDEGPGRIIYWDSSSNALKEAWLSD